MTEAENLHQKPQQPLLQAMPPNARVGESLRRSRTLAEASRIPQRHINYKEGFTPLLELCAGEGNLAATT